MKVSKGVETKTVYQITLSQEEALEVRRLVGRSTGGPSDTRLFAGSLQPTADLEFWNFARELLEPIYNMIRREESK